MLKMGSKTMKRSITWSQENTDTPFLDLKLAAGKHLDIVEAFSSQETQNCASLVDRQ